MPAAASRSGIPSGGEGQLTHTGFSARCAKPSMTAEISAPLAASEPAMTRIAWISGSAATASSACGRSARDSARNAVVGVRSSGLAAVATEMSSGRSRSTHAALSAGVAEPELRALVHRQDAVAAAERDDAHAPAGRRPAAVPDQQERDVDQLLDRVRRGSRPAPAGRRPPRDPRRRARRCGPAPPGRWRSSRPP